MKHILILLAVTFGAPVLLNAALSSPIVAGVPEAASWALMLLGVGGTAVSVRLARGAWANRVPKSGNRFSDQNAG